VTSEVDANWEITAWSLAKNLGAKSLSLMEDGDILCVFPDE
jgi:hypothetical protein